MIQIWFKNANERILSTQGKNHEYSYEMGSVSALTNQIAFKKNKQTTTRYLNALTLAIISCIEQYYFLRQ